jgi:hypothetical protein
MVGSGRTYLRSLELGELLVRAKQSLNGLHILFLTEAGEGIEVI